MEMLVWEPHNVKVLDGEKAVKALSDYINEMEDKKRQNLTEKQAQAMIQLARGLISTIETEMRKPTLPKDIGGKYALQPTFATYEIAISRESAQT